MTRERECYDSEHPGGTRRHSRSGASSSDQTKSESGSAAVNALQPEKVAALMNALTYQDNEIVVNGQKVNAIAEGSWALLNAAMIMDEGGTLPGDDAQEEQTLQNVPQLKDLLIELEIQKEKQHEQEARLAKERLAKEQALLDLFHDIAGDVTDAGVWSCAKEIIFLDFICLWS